MPITPGSGPGGLVRAAYPILEFDPEREALIEPSVHLCAPSRQDVDVPSRRSCAFSAMSSVRSRPSGGPGKWPACIPSTASTRSSSSRHRGERVAFFQPGVGAPLAALFLEEAIDYGCRVLVACGGAGALDAALALGHPVVVSAAVRDEGTSYHYLPLSRLIEADPAVVSAIEGVLSRSGVPFTTGITWSTDAVYRETREKVSLRRAEGCITVEMEAAALLAVARFRGVVLGQLLYAGDSLAGDSWDHRDWVHAHDVREALFWLAMDAVVELPLAS